MKSAVALLTQREDLHGHLVADALARIGRPVHLIATDDLADRASISWNVTEPNSFIRDLAGTRVDPATLGAIWWRRVRVRSDGKGGHSAEAVKLMTAETQTALFGLLATEFRGTWVNDPQAEVTADNKLVQLRTAQRVGFAIPQTLVSSDPKSIRTFVQSVGGQAVVKVARGISDFSVPARKIASEDLENEDALMACPAIYQSLVPGDTHLRVHVFGPTVESVEIRSPHLDWRPDLNVPIAPLQTPRALSRKCRELVASLGLKMGIIDLKIDENGAHVFLEINPQGQFAFVEGLTGLPLGARLASVFDRLCNRFDKVHMAPSKGAMAEMELG